MKPFVHFLLISLMIYSCGNSQTNNPVADPVSTTVKKTQPEIIVGAEQPELYLNLLKNKRIGLVVNQSSLFKQKHLLDFLIENKVNVVKIFAPEHGFRGNIERGGLVKSEIDVKTGLPIVSMYGKNRKPSNEQLKDLDIVIFDIQDAGARFFTYISSLHEVMEACAANSKQLIVLDRPNPLGDYIDGPVMRPKFKSFVGMHPIPINGLILACNVN